MFKKMIEWLTKPQLNDIEQFISSHNPKSPADVEQLIREFNSKRGLQCF
jgi:hypothetical protein